jgi:hypothetical protein
MPPCGPRMDNSSVGSFTGTDEFNVTNLLAFKITIEESHCQSIDALHATQRTHTILVDSTAATTKEILPPRVLSLTLLMDDSAAAFAHFPLKPLFLSSWVTTTLTCHTRPVTFTSTGTVGLRNNHVISAYENI